MSQPLSQSSNTGNTKPCSPKKSKTFLLTLNEVERWESLKSYLCGRNFDYILCCQHDGPSKIHYHIYIQFPNATTLDVDKIEGSHIEKCLGSAQQNIRYCKAVDDKHLLLGVNGSVIFESGKPKLKGGCHVTYKQAQEMSSDAIAELDVRTALMVKKIQAEPQPVSVKDWHKEVKVFFIWGPSGSGKSTKARELVIENGYESFDEVNYRNTFWNGVSGKTQACIYDDWRPSDMPAAEFVKFIDYNKHTLNTKGGFKVNNYNLIIITCIFSPELIYSSLCGEPRIQWLRRMTIIPTCESEERPESAMDKELDRSECELALTPELFPRTD